MGTDILDQRQFRALFQFLDHLIADRSVQVERELVIELESMGIVLDAAGHGPSEITAIMD
jgi:hypothetical protein